MGRGSGRRSVRVGNLLQEELAAILRRDLGDPRLGLVSVTAVEVTDDLRHARVFVSILGEEDERQGALAALVHAAPLIRGRLGRHVILRRIPELEFRYDSSLDNSFRIQNILHELQRDAEAEGES